MSTIAREWAERVSNWSTEGTSIAHSPVPSRGDHLPSESSVFEFPGRGLNRLEMKEADHIRDLHLWLDDNNRHMQAALSESSRTLSHCPGPTPHFQPLLPHPLPH